MISVAERMTTAMTTPAVRFASLLRAPAAVTSAVALATARRVPAEVAALWQTDEVRRSRPSVRDDLALRALAGVTLAIEEGEFFGLLGPNGAGKTTTLRIAAGLLEAPPEIITVGGEAIPADLWRDTRAAVPWVAFIDG